MSSSEGTIQHESYLNQGLYIDINAEIAGGESVVGSCV